MKKFLREKNVIRFIVICQYEEIFAALYITQFMWEEDDAILLDWFYDKCTIKLRFGKNWWVKISKCECQK